MESTLPDHDTLIALRTEFTTFTKQYGLDMKELKDNYSFKIAEHELRIHKIESIIETTNLVSTINDFSLVKQDVHDFKTTAMVWRTVAGLAGGAVFFALTQLPGIIKTWFR